MNNFLTQKDSFYSKVVMGEHLESPPLIHQAQAKILRESASEVMNLKLLDIGSGAGAGAAFIAHVAQIETVICVDLSISALEKVKELGFLPLIASAEGHKLPFKDESFDIVILDEVIEHLVDTDSIMEEIHRVLAQDGQLLISTPNLASWFNRLALMFGIQPAFSEVSFKKVYGRPGADIVGHLRLFTKRALVEFVLENGFRVSKVVGVPFPVLPNQIRLIDQFFANFPSLAGGLVLRADKISKSAA
jgi:2-polyprenyl-3-methyl-5-hydroxy-6-metoxy-1,4-benzoquinol methylase